MKCAVIRSIKYVCKIISKSTFKCLCSFVFHTVQNVDGFARNGQSRTYNNEGLNILILNFHVWGVMYVYGGWT